MSLLRLGLRSLVRVGAARRLAVASVDRDCEADIPAAGTQQTDSARRVAVDCATGTLADWRCMSRQHIRCFAGLVVMNECPEIETDR